VRAPVAPYVTCDENVPSNGIAHISFYTQSKRLTNYYAPFPLHYKQLRPWEVCSLNDLWSFVASHSHMHFTNRCTWKS